MEPLSDFYQKFTLTYTGDGAPKILEGDLSWGRRILEEIARRSASTRRGRPWKSREVRLRNMLKARDALRAVDEPVTQASLLTQMDHAGDTRRVRQWLQDCHLSWAQFLALD